MDKNTFREKIYGPYHDIWKIIKIIEYASKDAKDDKTWEHYMNMIEQYAKAYPRCQIDGTYEDYHVKALLEAAEIIAKENSKEENANV